MKKIIYSLVIMIAAGSLFTSCIEQVEPAGIQDLRYAKAEYIRALKDLRAADAELQRAKAEVEKANARYRDAQTAHENAITDGQKLLNDYQKLLNEAKAKENEGEAAKIEAMIEQLKMDMEEAQKQHEINMVNLANNLAQAQEALRVALRDIALAGQDLTPKEKAALQAALAEYEAAFKDLEQKKVDLFEAEQKLFLAQNAYEADFGVYLPKKDDYEYQLMKWEFYKEYFQALLDDVPDPDNEDLNEWKEILDGYEQKKAELLYSLHEIMEEVSLYYVTYVHDGVEAYNHALDLWADENPAVADPGDEPEYKDGDPTYTTSFDITIDDVDYPAGTTFGLGSKEAIEFPTLKVGTTPAYLKFNALMESFTNSDWTGNGDMVLTIGSEYVVSGNQPMKDFILGDEMGNVGTQKYKDEDEGIDLVADYGLYGAISVLKRDKVLNPDTPADPEKAKKEAADAQKKWKEHHDILAAVRDSVDDKNCKDPYNAYEPYRTAKKALETAAEKYAPGAPGFAAAITEFIDKGWNSVAGHTSWTINDTTAIFNTMLAVAKARDEFMGYKYDKKTDKHDFSKFYYASASNPKLIDSTIALSGLTLDGFRKWEDRSTYGVGSKYGFGIPNGKMGEYQEMSHDVVIGFTAQNCAFTNWCLQLFGQKAATEMSQGNIAVISTDAEKEALINDYYNWLFFGIAKYNAADNKIVYAKDITNEDGDVIHKVGDDFVPSQYEAAVNELAKQKKALEDIYRDFWGLKAATSVPAVKNWNDPDCYSAATFTEPFNIVTFSGAANKVDWTKGMGVILGSVDPNKAGTTGDNFNASGLVSGSAIFGTEKASDFANWMYKEYLYQLALQPATGDIAVLEAWVNDVANTFGESSAEAIAKAKEAYEADKAVYDELKKEYDAYDAALKEFTGEDEDGNAIGLQYIVNDYSTLAKFYDPDGAPAFNFELCALDIFGDFTGEWIDELQAKQLELAEEIFPELPTLIKDWAQRHHDINEEALHNQILYDACQAAYLAAAKAIGYDKEIDPDGDYGASSATTFQELWDAYMAARQDYIDYLKSMIKTMDSLIASTTKTLADWDAGVSAEQLAIAQAQMAYNIAEENLRAAQARFDAAEKVLNDLLEYLQSLVD